MTASGFLPEHPVRLYIGNSLVAKLTANGTGTVSFVIQPASLHLAAGDHMIELTSMLLSQRQRFMVR